VESLAPDVIAPLYFQTRIAYHTKKGLRWQVVWQLMDYDINNDKVIKLYKYRKAAKDESGKSVMPDPRPDDLAGRTFVTPDLIPPPALHMLREKVYYYKVRAKRDG